MSKKIIFILFIETCIFEKYVKGKLGIQPKYQISSNKNINKHFGRQYKNSKTCDNFFENRLKFKNNKLKKHLSLRFLYLKKSILEGSKTKM